MMQVDDSNQTQLFSNISNPWQHIYKVPFEEVSPQRERVARGPSRQRNNNARASLRRCFRRPWPERQPRARRYRTSCHSAGRS